MADDEIRQKIVVEHEQAMAALAQVTRHLNDLGNAVKNGGDDAADASRGHAELAGQLKNLVAGMVGSFGLVQVYQSWLGTLREVNAAMEQNAALANQVAEAQTDMMFLNQGNRPDELAAVREAAKLKGGPGAVIDAMKAFAELKSKTSTLDDAARIKLFEQMVETSMTTTTPMSGLIGLFAKGSDYVSDPNRLQAIIRETQNLSPAATPAVLEKTLPSILSVGSVAGMTPEEGAGLLTAALKVNEETGATMLVNILKRLAGQGTPEQLDMLKAAGVTEDMGMVERLRRVRGANLTLPQMGVLFGEASTVYGGMAQMNAFDSFIKSIQAASLGGRDMTAEALQAITAGDEQYRLTRQSAQWQAEQDVLGSQDVQSQRSVAFEQYLKTVTARRVASGEMTPRQKAIADARIERYSRWDRSWINVPDRMIASPIFERGILPQVRTLEESEQLDQIVRDFNTSGPNLDVSGIGRAYRGATVNDNRTIINTQYNADDPVRNTTGRATPPDGQ